MAESPRRLQDSEEIGSRRSKKDKFYEFLEDHFFWILIGIACTGMVLAFTVPLWVCSFSAEDSVSALRQAILAATGGTLAIFTLLETHQKNIREKEKNEQDHIRQVHAERRSRYAKAIEQLADEKAPIRLGGVYTLAKLVDEWLADKNTLPSKKKRRQEGQIIIDSLCAYIRSSFPLAERYDELTLSYEEYQQNRQGNQDLHSPQVIPLPKPKNAKQSREEFVRDKSLFQEEQEVRKTILSEIKHRLNGGKVKHEDGKHEIKPGTWSYFKYNFSNAVFFYPVDLKIANFSREIEFRYAKFIDTANFYFTTFFVAIFAGVEFSHDAKFSHAVFKEYTDFSSTTFIGNTLFKHSKYLAKPQFTYKSSGVYTTARFAEGSKNNFSFINNGIETKRHFSRNGVVTIIPKGCVVFDPITQETIQHYPLFDNENTIIPEIKEKLQMSDWPKKQNWHISA